MSLRTTLILLALAAALGLIVFLSRDAPQSNVPAGEKLLAPGLDVGGSTRVELTNFTGEVMTFERAGTGWNMVFPLKDRADADRMNHLLGILSQSPAWEVARAPSEEMLQKLGLEPAKARLSVLGPGEPLRLRIGERDATRAWLHVMVEGDDIVYRTGANVANALEKNRQEWQDPRFLSGDGALVQRFTLQRPDEPRIVASRSGADWSLEEPFAFEADASLLNSLVNGLLGLTIETFVELEPTDEELLRAGFGEFATVATFDWGGGRTLEARFGIESPKTGLRYATSSERPLVFAVGGPALALLDTDTDRFRDPHVCRITQRTTSGFTLRRDGREVMALRFEPTEQRFRIESPFERPTHDDRTSPLYAWFVDVRDLKATDFLSVADAGAEEVDALAALGLDPPRAELVLRRAAGAATSTEEIVHFGDDIGDGVAVRRTDRFPDVVYVVPAAAVARVVGADPRQFLETRVLPEDLMQWKEVTLRAGGREATIRRDEAKGGLEFWRDPKAPDANTSAFQEFVHGLPEYHALRFLPRDPQPEDGLDPPQAEIAIQLSSGTRTVRLGARGPEGVTVVAACDEAFPPRTVFELDAAVLDGLLAVLNRPGG